MTGFSHSAWLGVFAWLSHDYKRVWTWEGLYHVTDFDQLEKLLVRLHSDSYGKGA